MAQPSPFIEAEAVKAALGQEITPRAPAVERQSAEQKLEKKKNLLDKVLGGFR